MPRLLRAAASLAIVPLLLVAGCNSSTTNDGKSSSSGALDADESIKIGGVVSKTSAVGTSKADTDLGAKARFMMANDEGGVHGRKIDYIGAKDDGQDPGRTVSAVRQLAQQDKVFAVVPINTLTIGSSGDFLNTNKTPYIGWGSAAAYCNKEYGMGYNGCLLPSPGGNLPTTWPKTLASLVGGAQGKTVAMIAQDSDAAKAGMAMYGKVFPAAGFTVSYAKATVPANATPTDWSAWVGEIMTSNNGKAPDIIAPMIAAPTNTGLYTALKRAGYQGILTDAAGYDPALLKQAATREALQDVYFIAQDLPFESPDPEMAKFKEYISKANGSPVTEWNQSMMVGWNSADLFLAIAEKAGPDLSVESYQAAAANFQDSYPLTGDRKFPEGRKQSFGCGALVQLKGTEYKMSTPYECFPSVPIQ